MPFDEELRLKALGSYENLPPKQKVLAGRILAAANEQQKAGRKKKKGT